MFYPDAIQMGHENHQASQTQLLQSWPFDNVVSPQLTVTEHVVLWLGWKAL